MEKGSGPGRPGTDDELEPDMAGAGAAELAPLLYPDLRRAARGIRARSSGSALQTTALIHEAYLKMASVGPWKSHRHFLASAAVAMRHVMVDEARSRLRLCRGEGRTPISLDDPDNYTQAQQALMVTESETRVVVGDAVEQLAAIEPRMARVVECRYFAGYTEVETADILGVTERTVRRDWIKARAWLQKELGDYRGVTDPADEGATS
ncbi:ECF-type sigma factor [Novilysobacter avium]|uniref:Sigma-70 family RNA polymerase sigma factor n=2 Tax=Lysobacteraceae TaxID=32033 RepID=A0A7S6ULC0_9GAMM|nr:ECF-type sigma factor [Lysobacter avium]QOW22448.1 sigma-70 family RNA polymerase sigma factor [Lysobacter avium]QOW24961.1 sigma-70 family RNA polymerase sigma factor [Lysobacter sp. H23M47]